MMTDLEASDPRGGWKLLLEHLDVEWPERASALRKQYAETIALLSVDSFHPDLDDEEVADLTMALVWATNEVLERRRI